MELENTITKGSETLHIAGDTSKSEYLIPVNEDWSMVCEVVSVENGIVQGTKIWDEANPKKIFFAELRYLGQTGTPPDNALRVGEYVVFQRVGDFNDPGPYTGFAKHDSTAGLSSFVCFVGYYPVVLVEDIGEGKGREVTIDASGNKTIPPDSETLTMYSVDPTTQFYNSTPPWAVGRIYPGQKFASTNGNYYRVWLPGFGDTQKTWTIAAGDFTFTLKTDNSGHIKDFSVV